MSPNLVTLTYTRNAVLSGESYEYKLRTCPHRVNVRIFRHNFVGDKAIIRRRAVALQGFLRQYRTKIVLKMRREIVRQIV